VLSARGWKSGDVAIVTSMYGNEVVAVRCGTGDNQGWAYADVLEGKPTQHWSSDRDGLHVVRPLVVIDPGPTDTNAAALSDLLTTAARSCRHRDRLEAMRACQWLADEIRNQTAPPQPQEPAGLGAVVEDADGDLWVKWSTLHRADRNWKRHDSHGGNYLAWTDLAVVRVLSEGVPC
jgi:hypothetical protein